MAKKKNDPGKYQSRAGQGLDIMTNLPWRFTVTASIIMGAVKPDAISRKNMCYWISGCFWICDFCLNFTFQRDFLHQPDSCKCAEVDPSCFRQSLAEQQPPACLCTRGLVPLTAADPSFLQDLMGTCGPDSQCIPPRTHQHHTRRRNRSCVSHRKEFWWCFSLFYNSSANKCSPTASNPLLPKLLCLRYSIEMPSHSYHTTLHCHSFTDMISKMCPAMWASTGLWNENAAVACSIRAALLNCRAIVKRRGPLFLTTWTLFWMLHLEI